jgi:hypothetical protein
MDSGLETKSQELPQGPTLQHATQGGSQYDQ